jgi:hypothetical protein
MTIDIGDAGHDAFLRGYPDVAQHRAGELGEEALNEVEPRAMLGDEGELEASSWSRSPPSSGFSRYVRGMIVEDQFDCGTGRVSGIEKLEEFDELAAAVTVSDERVDLASEQIDTRQQAERAMAFVLMIPCKGGVQPVHVRAHGVPAGASSTVNADSRGPWLCRTRQIPAKPWLPA